MEKERLHPSGFSAMTVTAVFSLALLIGIGGWKTEEALHPQKPPLNVAVSDAASSSETTSNTVNALSALGAGTTTDPISQITPEVVQALAGDYFSMQQSGTYSAQAAQEDGQTLGSQVQAQVSYQGYTPSEIPTRSDTSFASMMQYRSDLQASLKPLLNNKEYELTIYGEYVQTGNAQYLTQLQAAAQNYTLAASDTAAVVVPEDAVQVQLGMLNAMQEFAAVLNAMATHAGDPIASTVLLENYNQAESDMETSFNALATYEKSKNP